MPWGDSGGWRKNPEGLEGKSERMEGLEENPRGSWRMWNGENGDLEQETLSKDP